MAYNVQVSQESCFCLKNDDAINKRCTNRVTRSVLEIPRPHFYARPSQARAAQKRSGLVFPGTDRVTRLVNRYKQDLINFC